MISDLNLLCCRQYMCVLDPILQVVVPYYVLCPGNPGVTIAGPTPGDDHSMRSSCIRLPLMRWSGSLLKGEP